MSHFAPLKASKRVLDLFLFEGGKALFRVCVALFKIYEKTLLSTSDFDTIIDLLLNMPVNVPAGSLIEVNQKEREGEGRVLINATFRPSPQ